MISQGGSGGIEIIPLSRAEVAASGLSHSHSGEVHKSNTSSSLKDFRPDSLDAKRKSGSLGSNSGSSNSSSSSSKKRKYDDNGLVGIEL